MNDFIDEIFTNTGAGLDAELNNLTINSMNSKNDKFNLDREENLVVNSITTKLSSSSGLTFDDIYPVGVYYETSDEHFDPNVSWQGTWVLDTKGRATVSKDPDQVEFDTINKVGGNKSPQQHYHDIRFNRPDGLGVSISCTGDGGEVLNITNWAWQHNFFNEFDSSSHLRTNYAGTGEAGNLQPYIVVNRWHRIA